MTSGHDLLPRYIDGSKYRLFLIEYRPRRTVRGTVLFIPPFAEEMNRSRRMMSVQAARLCEMGFRCILPDLSGTGDSFGSFEETHMDLWLRDLSTVHANSVSKDDEPVFVIAIRFGAILGASWIELNDITTAGLVLWSPSLSGSAYMNQFLRLRLMSAMLSGNENPEKLTDLVSRLERGHSIDVAGYRISSQLYSSICEATLEEALVQPSAPICWLELVNKADAPLPRPVVATSEKLQARSCDVRVVPVQDNRFWNSAETTTAPAVMTATEAFIDSIRRAL